MGNKSAKQETLLGVMETLDRGDENEYKTMEVDGVKVHRLEGVYFVENDDCTLGPMTRKQVEDLGREKKEVRLLEKEVNVGRIGDPKKRRILKDLDQMRKKLGGIMSGTCHISSKISAAGDVLENINERTSVLNGNISIKNNERWQPQRQDTMNMKYRNRFYSSKLKKKMTFFERNNITESKKISKIKVKPFNLSYLKQKRNMFYNVRKVSKYLEDKVSSFEKSNSSQKNIRSNIGFTVPINDDRIRYTAYVNMDLIKWSKQKAMIRRLSPGFFQRFGCNIQLGDEQIKYRGNLYYTIYIDGADEVSVLKCRNSLPKELSSILIQPQNNSEESSNIINGKWCTYIRHSSELLKPLNAV